MFETHETCRFFTSGSSQPVMSQYFTDAVCYYAAHMKPTSLDL